jgi:hypothetical protein
MLVIKTKAIIDLREVALHFAVRYILNKKHLQSKTDLTQ